MVAWLWEYWLAVLAVIFAVLLCWAFIYGAGVVSEQRFPPDEPDRDE